MASLDSDEQSEHPALSLAADPSPDFDADTREHALALMRFEDDGNAHVCDVVLRTQTAGKL